MSKQKPEIIIDEMLTKLANKKGEEEICFDAEDASRLYKFIVMSHTYTEKITTYAAFLEQRLLEEDQKRKDDGIWTP